MTTSPEDILRELREWCREGQIRFAATVNAAPDAARQSRVRASRATLPPRWAYEMHGHTDIPISQLMTVFRADRGQVVVVAVKPNWGIPNAERPNAERRNAERLRCTATLHLMAAQLVQGQDSRPGGLPRAELEDRCRAMPLVKMSSGESKRVLERGRFADAYSTDGLVPTVSLAFEKTDDSRTLTVLARAACKWAVRAALSPAAP